MTRPVRFGLAALGVALVAGGAAAQAPAGLDYAPPAPPPPPDPVWLVARLVGMTAVLLGLCGLVAWLARRANRGGLTTGADNGRMELVGALPLGGRSAVHLIRVDGRAVAVTTDATGVRSVVVLSESFGAALEDAAPGTAVAAGRAA